MTVARPVEKDRKQVHDEAKSKPVNKSRDRPDSSHERPTCDSLDHKSKAPRLDDPVSFDYLVLELCVFFHLCSR